MKEIMKKNIVKLIELMQIECIVRKSTHHWQKQSGRFFISSRSIFNATKLSDSIWANRMRLTNTEISWLV